MLADAELRQETVHKLEAALLDARTAAADAAADAAQAAEQSTEMEQELAACREEAAAAWAEAGASREEVEVLAAQLRQVVGEAEGMLTELAASREEVSYSVGCEGVPVLMVVVVLLMHVRALQRWCCCVGDPGWRPCGVLLLFIVFPENKCPL